MRPRPPPGTFLSAAPAGAPPATCGSCAPTQWSRPAHIAAGKRVWDRVNVWYLANVGEAAFSYVAVAKSVGAAHTWGLQKCCSCAYAGVMFPHQLPGSCRCRGRLWAEGLTDGAGGGCKG
eukprot:366455-Chlamydomonas_euryale.AAC.11